MRQQEAADRDELLQQAEMGRQIKNEMDEEAAVMGHINRSRRYLNDMFEQGSSILVNMSSNRERIKVRAAVGSLDRPGCGPKLAGQGDAFNRRRCVPRQWLVLSLLATKPTDCVEVAPLSGSSLCIMEDAAKEASVSIMVSSRWCASSLSHGVMTSPLPHHRPLVLPLLP